MAAKGQKRNDESNAVSPLFVDFFALIPSTQILVSHELKTDIRIRVCAAVLACPSVDRRLNLRSIGLRHWRLFFAVFSSFGRPGHQSRCDNCR